MRLAMGAAAGVNPALILARARIWSGRTERPECGQARLVRAQEIGDLRPSSMARMASPMWVERRAWSEWPSGRPLAVQKAFGRPRVEVGQRPLLCGLFPIRKRLATARSAFQSVRASRWDGS